MASLPARLCPRQQGTLQVGKRLTPPFIVLLPTSVEFLKLVMNDGTQPRGLKRTEWNSSNMQEKKQVLPRRACGRPGLPCCREALGSDGSGIRCPTTLDTAAVCCMSLTVQAHIWLSVALGPGWAISGVPAFYTHSLWSQGNKRAPSALPGAPYACLPSLLRAQPLTTGDFGHRSKVRSRQRTGREQPGSGSRKTVLKPPFVTMTVLETPPWDSAALPGRGVLSCDWAVPPAVAAGSH